MKVSTQTLVCLAGLIIGVIPGTAQEQLREGAWKAPVIHDQVISGNPFLLLGDWGGPGHRWVGDSPEPPTPERGLRFLTSVL